MICFVIFSKFYFRSIKSFSYTKLTKAYFSFLIILIIFSMKFNYLNYDLSFNYLCLIMNIMLFINYILVVGIKYTMSPSGKLIECLEKNTPCNKEKILSYLKDLNLIEQRIEILQKEKLLLLKHNSLSLTKYGNTFSRIFVLIKNFLGLKAEG